MNPATLQSYISLVLKVTALEQKLQKNPPHDVEEYQAAISQVASLWAEIAQLSKTSELTPADIAAIHAGNQTVFERPAGGHPDQPFLYNAIIPNRPHLSLLKSGDSIYGRPVANPTQFFVTPGDGIIVRVPTGFEFIESKA